MDDKLKSQLDGIFAAHEQRKSQQIKAADERQRRKDEYLVAFETKVREVVRPAFDVFAAYLTGKGIESRIQMQQAGSGGSHVPARVAMHFMISDDERTARTSNGPRDFPLLALICEPSDQHVRLHRSTLMPGRGGQSGDYGKASLDQITAEFVQDHLAQLLKSVLAP